MSGNRFPTNGSGSVFNSTTTTNNTRQLLYPGAFRNYPWGRNNTYLAEPIVPGMGRGEPEAPSLSLGERVVWLKDSGPEIGTARWIGRLPLVSPDWSVGVEFDRPIGTGDGKFGTKQYFKTTPNHAFFLPIMTLMKAEEYDGEKTFDGRRSSSREKETHFLPPKNKNQWEKSSCPPEERCNTHAFHDQEHCCNHRKYPTSGPGNCYHEPGTCCATTEGPRKSGPPGGPRCFVTSTPRNATRHKSVTIKETVGNVPGFGEWSDEDELSKFPFKSWKSSSRQSVVSCPASVGPQTILIAKELTSDSSDSDGRGGKFKTLMACFLPGQAYRDKKKRKRRKYVLASEKNKISYVSGPEGRQPEKNAVLGAVSGGGDLWRSPRGNVVTSSCSAFPPSSHQHCQSCSHVASPSPPSVLPPPRKNFSCSGLEKLNAGSCRACDYPPSAGATPITPLKKKTQAPSPPVNYHHRPVSPKRFDQSALIKSDVKPAASQSSINSATTTRTPRQPVIRSLDAARNEIDISMIATKYTFVGNNGSRNNSVSTLARKTEDSPKPEVKVLKPLNNDPLTISPHPRRTPKKKAPQPPCSSGSELSLARMDEQPGEELKKDPSGKKRMAPLPPALPRKTLPHDTMTLFGYTPREGLSRASSGATLEINLDKSLASEGSANDLLSMMGEELYHETTPEKLLKKLEEEIPALQRNLASSSIKKYPDDDAKSVKILNTDIQTMDKVKKTDTKGKDATKELNAKLTSKKEVKKDENVASSSKISLNIKPTKEEKVKKTKENKDDKKDLPVASSSKKDVPAPSSSKKDPEVAAPTLSKKKEAQPSSSKKKEVASSTSKTEVSGPSSSKMTLNIVENKPEVKPAMKSSASQTNLSKEEPAAVVKPKKSKLKLLGGSKKSKKEEGSQDEVTEILTEIEQVVKSKPTVHDFVAAFTKFTEKAEQIAKNHQSAGPAPVAPEPKPVKKISPPKVKLVPLPVVLPITKEEKKSLKSFPTKWTFNFKSKDKKPVPATSSSGQTGSLTRNESSPCLESRSETVKTVVPQASVPLSRKTYNNNTAPVDPTDFRVAVDPTPDRATLAKDDSQNSQFGPFIQNREALRRLSKETRNRHGSTLSLGRYASGERNMMATLEEDPSFNRKSFTPNASPIMARHRNAICAGKPPLPVKMVHDALAEQSGSSANLFSQLEAAIANGQHQKAAVLARELALQKVNGSLGRFKNKEKTEDKFTTVSLYIEDKNSHQGPIPITIYPKMTVAMLKQKVEKEFHFKPECQRWILGKTFVVRDDSTMINLDVCTPGCPIFLYIVAPSTEKKKAEQAMASESEEEEEEPVKVVPEVKKTIAELPLSQQQIESYEALTEIVNRMTAVTKNMLMAEELQRSLATVTTKEVEAPLETLEEENVEYHLAEQVAEEVISEPEVSEESEAPIVDVESDVTEEEEVDEEEEEEENGIEDDSDDNNEVFEDAKQQNYQELVQLEERDLIANVEVFECPVCFVDIEVGEGTILRDCLHNFCKDCLSKAVEYSDDAVIKCPFRNHEYSCDSHLLEREIKALVTPEMFEKHLQRSMVAAESKAANSFHCKSPDCPGWCLYEDNVNVFHCPVCSLENCLTCQAIHAGKNCKQYQDEIEYEAADSEDAKKTKEYLDNMVKEGQAMHCPSCRVIVMKKWGCDWLKCSVCKTEICWVTKGPRWGPAGRGDTSAGCKCGVNGVRCHNLCNYCH